MLQGMQGNDEGGIFELSILAEFLLGVMGDKDMDKYRGKGKQFKMKLFLQVLTRKRDLHWNSNAALHS
eukprot:425581-Rhodomonas_salina.2